VDGKARPGATRVFLKHGLDFCCGGRRPVEEACAEKVEAVHADKPTCPRGLAGLFWIATAFLAAGLFLGPAVGGAEPRFQRLGVNLLFGALLLVVGGSLAGEYLAIHRGSAWPRASGSATRATSTWSWGGPGSSPCSPGSPSGWP